MRKIRDVLRLHAGGLSKRRIAVSLTIGRTSVGDYNPNDVETVALSLID